MSRIQKPLLFTTSALVVLLIAAGVIAWLFLSGRIIWASNETDQQNVSQLALPNARAVVCGDEIVSRYNKAVTYEQRNDSSERLTPDSAGLATVAAEIRSLQASADDPSCQSILLWVAIEESNYNQAKDAYDRLVKLHDLNFFPNNNLVNNQPLVVYESALDFLRNGSGASGE